MILCDNYHFYYLLWLVFVVSLVAPLLCFCSEFIDNFPDKQLLDTDVKRKIKKEPALAVEMSNNAFTSNVGANEQEQVAGGDLISDLWTFLWRYFALEYIRRDVAPSFYGKGKCPTRI